ncbi:hypothetical protein FGO68_gene17484 [Halteria grandinella]|uniref:Uncharacterized protein n=1 Tax=Halteria grandinella TaxID=5974 RepID=A0A8J8T2F5_HALGN|nr:hypothetical protein FGO68_gene17484 [Halteria grandinella]
MPFKWRIPHLGNYLLQIIGLQNQIATIRIPTKSNCSLAGSDSPLQQNFADQMQISKPNIFSNSKQTPYLTNFGVCLLLTRSH